jgi:hypothetical protein
VQTVQAAARFSDDLLADGVRADRKDALLTTLLSSSSADRSTVGVLWQVAGYVLRVLETRDYLRGT